MDPRSQKASAFASSFLYEPEFDFAVKQACRHQQTLEELLEHSAIDKIWKQIVAPEAPALQKVDQDHDTDMNKSILVSLMPPENLTKLSAPENAPKLEVVEGAADTARKQVKSQIQTVDGSLSLDKLAKLMRSMEILNKVRGSSDSSVLFLYTLESAGEHERDSRRSPTPARREHMEKLLRAAFCTRGSEMPDLEDEKVIFPALHPSDMTLVLTFNQ